MERDDFAKLSAARNWKFFIAPSKWPRTATMRGPAALTSSVIGLPFKPETHFAFWRENVATVAVQ